MIYTPVAVGEPTALDFSSEQGISDSQGRHVFRDSEDQPDSSGQDLLPRVRPGFGTRGVRQTRFPVRDLYCWKSQISFLALHSIL